MLKTKCLVAVFMIVSVFVYAGESGKEKSKAIVRDGSKAAKTLLSNNAVQRKSFFEQYSDKSLSVYAPLTSVSEDSGKYRARFIIDSLKRINDIRIEVAVSKNTASSLETGKYYNFNFVLRKLAPGWGAIVLSGDILSGKGIVTTA